MPSSVLKRLSFLKRLFRDLPRQLKLTYCLLRDDRVPAVNKAAVAAALALVVTPFVNLPEWVPVLGEMDVLALTLLSTRLFIRSAPREAVEEHERLIKERRSRFDLDVARGERIASALARRFVRDQPAPDIEFVGAAQGRPSAAVQQLSGVIEA
jgi:uncharacterized membrane protein YkvA (DUF1232 family)